MSEKFTPGDWLTEGKTVYALQYCTWLGNPSKENRFYLGVQGKCDDEELIANAHLISQAPAMYRMLDGIAIRMHETDSGSIEDIIIIEALLTKARGE